MRRSAIVAVLVLSGCLGFHAGPMPGEPATDAYAVLEVDGAKVRVHYLDVGAGPPVVLVHGFASSLAVWKDVVPVLARDHRVIALDLKGFGWTDRPEGDYSPAAQARIVAALLDARGIESAAVVAHSWGSSVALALALAEPARVTRLVLYSAWVYEEQLPTFAIWSRAMLVGEALFRLFYTERTDDWVARAYHDQRHVTHELIEAERRAMRRPGARAAALAATRGQRYAELQTRYGRITQPALILWGREDRVALPRFGERLAVQLPNARLIVFPRTGHFPMIESAPRSIAALRAFLDAGPPRRPQPPAPPEAPVASSDDPASPP